MASRHFSFKTGKAGRGAKHAEYIAGQGKYSEREDVRYLVDRNLPGWAVDARDFFEAADQLERANGRAYSEIEFSIPRACVDPVAYADQYAVQLLGERHPYRLAIHDKLAADGGRNVHGHLMFSERQLDGIDRGREQFFRRANSKTPERGGAAKDRQWNDRKHIDTLRRGYEAHAQTHGIALDLRSNLAQGLAEPEPKIGPQRKRSTLDAQREGRAERVKRLRVVRREVVQVQAALVSAQVQEAVERQRAAQEAVERQRAAQEAVERQRVAQEAAERQRAAQIKTKEVPDMATPQDHQLVASATAKRAENPRYQPTQPELKAVDAVLVEQAQARLSPSSPHPPKAEPAQPAKTLAEQIADSLAAALAWIKSVAGQPKEAQPSKRYLGRIAYADEHHAVQSTGRAEYVVHSQANLPQPVKAADVLVDIAYGIGGKAQFRAGQQQGKTRGRV